MDSKGICEPLLQAESFASLSGWVPVVSGGSFRTGISFGSQSQERSRRPCDCRTGPLRWPDAGTAESGFETSSRF